MTRRPFWHLAEQSHWDRARLAGRYEQSTLGATLAQVGFIHCSYPEQLPAVAKALYAKVTDPLVVLEIDPDRLQEVGVEVRDEPADDTGDQGAAAGQLFPHLYGPLPVDAVLRTRTAAVERGWLDLGPWVGSSAPPDQGSTG